MIKKRVLITGAAGFIGYHLALFLQAQGHFVIGLDNFNDYYCPHLKRAREKELQKVGVTILKGELDQELLSFLIQTHQISHIVHLAAQAGVRYSLTHPHLYLKTNIEGFLEVLEACRRSPKTYLVYASSSSVYGANTKVPFSIEDRTDSPTNIYGVTKKTNESMAYTYQQLYGVRSCGLRYFTAYGPWGRPDMAYFHFAERILQGKPISLFNHGAMKRDFTYIDDIVQGTVAALDVELPYSLFNLGNHAPVELCKLVSLLEHNLEKKAEKIFLPMQPGEMLETYADINTSTQYLGFHPKVSIEEGIECFVAWLLPYRSSRRGMSTD